MKKLLLFLFAVIATLGLHAEKVALVANTASYSGDGTVTRTTTNATIDKYAVELNNSEGKTVIDCQFGRAAFYDSEIRTYKTASGKTDDIVFNPRDGIKITKITFNVSGTNYIKFGDQTTTTKEWSGSSINALTFHGGSNTTKVTYIEITYETAGPQDFILPTEADILIDEFQNILPEKHPENITWTSANENIATVENGVIFGHTLGSTTITASWEGSEAWNAGSVNIKVFVSIPKVFKQITSTNDLEIGKVYTFGYIAGNFVASNAENSRYFSSTNVNFTDGSFVENEDVLNFTITEVNAQGAYKIKLLNYLGENEYLKTTDKETTISKVDESDADFASITFTTQGNVNIQFNSTKDRYIKVYPDNSDFRNYTNTNSNGLVIQLFKEVEPAVQDNYRPRWKDQTLQLGNQYSTYKINLGLEGDYPNVTFTSSNEAVATVNGNVVTATGVGSAIITGTWEESDSWFGDSRAFNVTVIDPKKEPTLTFQHEIIHGKVGVGVAAQAAYYDGDGFVSYESSNTSAVTVDPNTGMIRKNDVKRVGKVFITATATAGATTNPASASYILYIDAVPTATDVEDATFDFTKNNYGMYEFNSENCIDENRIEYYEATVNQREDVDHNHVMIVNENGIILNFLDREGDIDGYRLWKDLAGENYDEVINYLCLYDCHFSITAPEGCTLETIEFLDHTDRLGEISADCGSFSPSNDDEDAIWNAGDKAISSVEFAATGKETHFGKIIVTLRDNTAGMKNPNLTFSDRIYTVTAEDIVEIQGADTEADVDIQYTIDNIDENDYIIETEDNVLQIMLADPGVYTLRATSEATDEYVAGMAIARIDVFPAIAPVYDETTTTTQENNVLLLPAQGGSVNFTSVDTPVSILVNDGDDEYLHDGSEFVIEENQDLHLTYTPVYAETFKHTSSDLHVYTMPAIPVYQHIGGTSHTLSWPEGQELYYKLTVEGEAKASAPAFRANDYEGYEKADGNQITFDTQALGLTAGQNLNIQTKTVKQTVNGPIETATYFNLPGEGGMSGIAGVEADSNSDVRFFNLEGVEMQGALAPGLYIRLSGTNAEKVTVK